MLKKKKLSSELSGGPEKDANIKVQLVSNDHPGETVNRVVKEEGREETGISLLNGTQVDIEDRFLNRVDTETLSNLNDVDENKNKGLE